MGEFSDYSVKNYYSKRNNNPLLPESIRGCMIGKSGCGKTNLLMNLLLDQFSNEEYLDYNNLYIFSTTLFQPCYQALINGFENALTKKEIRECFRKQDFIIEIPRRNPDSAEEKENAKPIINIIFHLSSFVFCWLFLLNKSNFLMELISSLNFDFSNLPFSPKFFPFLSIYLLISICFPNSCNPSYKVFQCMKKKEMIEFIALKNGSFQLNVKR
uniref:ABC transporter domain-containing protein n=1 Tax=Heterorhabditis bacteriophora TaxID=37862 RepID=A0A1I7WTL6_HETBA